MQSEVRVIQDERTEWRFDLDSAAPMSNAEGRNWLDAQFTQLGGVPLRPTGKLLLEEPGGGTREAELVAGKPYFKGEGVEHNVVNANPFELVFIEIELKK